VFYVLFHIFSLFEGYASAAGPFLKPAAQQIRGSAGCCSLETTETHLHILHRLSCFTYYMLAHLANMIRLAYGDLTHHNCAWIHIGLIMGFPSCAFLPLHQIAAEATSSNVHDNDDASFSNGNRVSSLLQRTQQQLERPLLEPCQQQQQRSQQQ
jgi:hypothetical protein